MEIQGPRPQSDEGSSGNGARNGAVGCGGSVFAAVTLCCGGLTTGTMEVRDLVSTYLAVPARAVGLGWFAAQPRPSPVTLPVEGGSCTLTWRRTGWETASYTLSCEAGAKDLEVTGVKLLSTPRFGGGETIFEDQRPMSGDEAHVESQSRWTYDGTIAVGWPPMTPGDLNRATVTVELDVGVAGRDKAHLRLEAPEPVR